MIVLVSTDGRPAQQLVVTKRTPLDVVQRMLHLPAGPCEWQTDNGSWALADPEARLYDIAGDLQGDGSNERKAFHVRTPAERAALAGPAGVRMLTLAGPAGVRMLTFATCSTCISKACCAICYCRNVKG